MTDRELDDSPLHDACGIVGIYDPNYQIDVNQYLVLALTALQHRGQESAGIAVTDPNGSIATVIGMGKARDVFAGGTGSLPHTACGIGHVRYSTTGSSCVENAGPFVVGPYGRLFDQLDIAHNGNVVNVEALREQLPASGVELRSSTDSEIIAALLMVASGQTLGKRLRTVAPLLHGAYSLVILSEGRLYGLRDPWGMRPLALGKLGDGYILASETCAFDRVGATYVRDLDPGELVTIDQHGVHSEHFVRESRRALCVFEYIYFSDATSTLEEREVYSTREALGRELAREHPADADLVTPVPETAIPFALAFARESGIPYAEAMISSRYADRSFIKPDQRLRKLEIDLKFNFISSKVEGKRLVLIDDSIVRGNTLKILIAALRRKGATAVHVRIGSPPLKNPCYFGVDIPSQEDLIASTRTVDEVRTYLGADSLGYLSLAGLGRALGAHGNPARAEDYLYRRFCFGCLEQHGYPFDPTSVPHAHRTPYQEERLPNVALV